jgi:hypothetical protein
MEYLHQEYHNVEVHHWMPKSKIQCNDFFVCCIPPELHYKIHSVKSPQWYIEKEGIENLLLDSATMFAKWLGQTWTMYHPHYDDFVEMIKRIHKNPTDYEYVLAETRKTAEAINTKGR